MSRSHTHAQHFLRSPRLVAELIGHSNVRKNDTVYDLGAGSGVITSVLAKRCRKVVAVEIEPNVLGKLRENTKALSNVTVLEQDILGVVPPDTPYKIFANIPFSFSADIVRKFTGTDRPPKSMYLIVQKQFAMKLVPDDRRFTSQLGAEISPWFNVRIRRPLRKTDFTPPPAVDTVLLEIKPRETPLLSTAEKNNYREFVATCFARQKYFTSLPREQVGISAERKPSELTPEQWVRLYATMKP